MINNGNYLGIEYDFVLNSDYELYSIGLSDLKSLVRSWYDGLDLSNFDTRHDYAKEYQKEDLRVRQMKLSGVVCNFFFAYKSDGRFYLMDGFNRLLADYGDIGVDQVVYLKVLCSQLKDHQLMLAMHRLNMWKLSYSGYSHNGFNTKLYFDRGFSLFLYSKFGITLYDMPSSMPNYEFRTRGQSDVKLLDYYFVGESEMSDDFKLSYPSVEKIMGNENIINDFRELVNCNDFIKQPFNNYSKFLNGFAMYMSYLRLTDYNSELNFDFFLNKLYEDKSFFRKLQGMSGTDSTRKNIYHFYRNLNLEKKAL